MARYNSGIYSLNEFKERAVLKLAPDAFVSFNNAYGHKIVSATPDGPTAYKDNPKGKSLDYHGGISAISVTNSVSPPGAGTCSLTVVCPQYEGLHESYYVEQDDGTKVPYFLPLMEVKVFMKGRFMPGAGFVTDGWDSAPTAGNSPRYYPVFWGFVSGISESYSGGVSTFNLTCRDMLGWWEYQNVNIVPGAINKNLGGQGMPSAATLFRYMNSWEIILNLFQEVGYDSFMYPAALKSGQIPNATPDSWRDDGDTKGSFALMRDHAVSYWDERFPFKKIISDTIKGIKSESILEMFGLAGRMDLSTTGGKDSSVKYVDPTQVGVERGQTTPQTNKKEDKDVALSNKVSPETGAILLSASNLMTAAVTPDFGMMNKVLPYGNFSETTVSNDAEPITESKLGIAAKVTDDLGFEFFLDFNGNFVFKPPFYNLDTSATNTFRILPSDIINFNENFETSLVVNAIDVTGPLVQTVTGPPISASHWDFASIAKFGLRYKSVKLPFGSNAKQLQALAVSEMAKANALTTTATLEIPLRAEMRLGYPVYIDHIDSFFYVKGITHSITFGSSATTSLTLDSKRSKVRNGTGAVMRAYIYRTVESIVQSSFGVKGLDPSAWPAGMKAAIDQRIKELNGSNSRVVRSDKSVAENQDMQDKGPSTRDKIYANQGFYQGLAHGLYTVAPSEAYYSLSPVSSSNALAPSKVTSRTLSEITYFTEDSVPYTDVSGYLHIGAFPFGANLQLAADFSLQDRTKLGFGTQLAHDLVSIGSDDQSISDATNVPDQNAVNNDHIADPSARAKTQAQDDSVKRDPKVTSDQLVGIGATEATASSLGYDEVNTYGPLKHENLPGTDARAKGNEAASKAIIAQGNFPLTNPATAPQGTDAQAAANVNSYITNISALAKTK